MRLCKLLICVSLLFCRLSFAQDSSEGIRTWLEEEDGSPSVVVYKAKVSNGSLTDNGDGTASVSTSGHDAVTLGTDADVLLGLSTQQLTLDSQSANLIFAGPGSGAATDPTFRSLVDDDVPDTITLSNLSQITTKSHTALSDIGTNAHSVIDTFIASKAAASGLASLDVSSLVVQNPANATATPTASKIPIADGSAKLDGWITLGASVDISSETNLAGDTEIVLTGDALSIGSTITRDTELSIYAPLASPVFTTSVQIPNGANPTVDAAGEIAQDTTDDQLLYGVTPRVIPYEHTRCIIIENLAAADDNYPFGMFNDPVTITGIGVHCDGTCTTAADIDLSDRAANAMTHGAPTVSVTTGNTTFTAVTAANTLVAGEGLEFSVANAVSPETDKYLICYTYTYDRQ